MCPCTTSGKMQLLRVNVRFISLLVSPQLAPLVCCDIAEACGEDPTVKNSFSRPWTSQRSLWVQVWTLCGPH